jgi:hypothetical protein
VSLAFPRPRECPITAGAYRHDDPAKPPQHFRSLTSITPSPSHSFGQILHDSRNTSTSNCKSAALVTCTFFPAALGGGKSNWANDAGSQEKKLPPPPAHHLNFSVFRSLQYISISKNFLTFYTQLISFLSQKPTNLLHTTRNNNHGCQRRSLSQDRCHCR